MKKESVITDFSNGIQIGRGVAGLEGFFYVANNCSTNPNSQDNYLHLDGRWRNSCKNEQGELTGYFPSFEEAMITAKLTKDMIVEER